MTIEQCFLKDNNSVRIKYCQKNILKCLSVIFVYTVVT